ncbi:MAG: PKD domain-containing protein [Trueperaceae bacterium]|nr:PKD domain-containing protein [Trueperaceae bacterium]
MPDDPARPAHAPTTPRSLGLGPTLRAVATLCVALPMLVACGRDGVGGAPSYGNDRAPIAAVAPDDVRAAVGSAVTFDASASRDPDGDAVRIAWTVDGPDAATTPSPTSGTTTVVTPGVPGTYEVTATARAGGARDAATSTLTALPAASGMADAGPDQSVAVGTRVDLDGRGSRSPTGDPLHYRWTLQRPANSAASLTDARTATPNVVPDVAGRYALTLRVDDGTVADADGVVVTANAGPSADAGPDVTVSATGVGVELRGTGRDPDGDPLTYAWARTSGPAPLTFGTPNAAATTVTPTTAGTYVLRFTASDGVTSASDDLQLTVASQTTVYVDALDGDDAAPGTARAPVATFEEALSRANASATIDTIQLSEGAHDNLAPIAVGSPSVAPAVGGKPGVPPKPLPVEDDLTVEGATSFDPRATVPSDASSLALNDRTISVTDGHALVLRNVALTGLTEALHLAPGARASLEGVRCDVGMRCLELRENADADVRTAVFALETPYASVPPASRGVRADKGGSDLRLREVTVSGFDVGVDLFSATASLTDVRVRAERIGISVGNVANFARPRVDLRGGLVADTPTCVESSRADVSMHDVALARCGVAYDVGPGSEASLARTSIVDAGAFPSTAGAIRVEGRSYATTRLTLRTTEIVRAAEAGIVLDGPKIHADFGVDGDPAQSTITTDAPTTWAVDDRRPDSGSQDSGTVTLHGLWFDDDGDWVTPMIDQTETGPGRLSEILVGTTYTYPYDIVNGAEVEVVGLIADGPTGPIGTTQ